MRVGAGVATDIGRVRERNEDSFLVDHPLYAVADGMGGHRGGAVASELALERVEELFRRGRASLADVVRSANRAVFERSMTDRAVSGMGTTLTAAMIDRDGVHLAHVGDSRAYLLRGGALRQLTEDHTLVNRMVKAGEISREEADVHPHRNVLTRTIGTEPDVKVDETDVPVILGDRFLLCSDGLTGMVAEDQIRSILEATPTPQEAADRLVKAANRAGGIDNITVIVLDIEEDVEEGADEDVEESGGDQAGVQRESTVLRGRPGTGAAKVSLPSRPRPEAIRRFTLRAGVVVLILLTTLVGARVFIDRQWYVGEAGGRVAVYQGIPAKLAGVSLSRVTFQTSIPAAEAESLPAYRGLSEGITANGREDALAIVEQIRSDLDAASGGGSR